MAMLVFGGEEEEGVIVVEEQPPQRKPDLVWTFLKLKFPGSSNHSK
jgi:hypothetical protein